MKTTYRPGSWRVKTTERYGAPSWDIYPPEIPVQGSRIPIAENVRSEMDARLIAAAPNLLSALEGLLNALPSATTHPAIQVARIAISKATGVQS